MIEAEHKVAIELMEAGYRVLFLAGEVYVHDNNVTYKVVARSDSQVQNNSFYKQWKVLLCRIEQGQLIGEAFNYTDLLMKSST